MTSRRIETHVAITLPDGQRIYQSLTSILSIRDGHCPELAVEEEKRRIKAQLKAGARIEVVE